MKKQIKNQKPIRDDIAPNKIFDMEEFDNIKDLIKNRVEKYKEKIAYQIKIENGKEKKYKYITYEKLLEDIESFGTSMYDLGFRNKRVGVIGKNQYNWVVAHLANLFGSIVSVPLDKDLENEELLNSVKRASLDCLVFDIKQKDKIEFLKQNLVNIKFICMQELSTYDNVDSLIEKGSILKKKDKTFIDNDIDCNEMAMLLFTSGTTSAPKAIMLSQKNIASNVYGLDCVEDVRCDDVNIAFLPFHHIFGSTGLLFMLSSGAKTVFPDGLKYIKQNLNEYGVSVFVGVPLLVESIYKAIQKEIKRLNKEKILKVAIGINNVTKKVGIDLSDKLFKQIIDSLGGKLRMIVVGGAPIREEVLKGFNDLGIVTLNGYGLSETAPVISCENYMKKGGAGFPICNVQIDIDSPDEDGIGEIKVKGPNVFKGYYLDEEKTNEVLKDGWFYTGDLGKIKDGRLYITGRLKSMIVLNNGKKIFPEEVEELIDDIDLVSESIVFGYVVDNKVIPTVKLVLDKECINENYKGKSNEELKQIVWDKIKELNTKFPRYKHIQKLIISDKELIKTTTKKIKRHIEIENTLKELDN